MNIAIVTGASSGMGREFVLQLGSFVSVEEIWVIARRAEALESLKQEVSTPIRVIPLDLCENESFETMQALLEKEILTAGETTDAGCAIDAGALTDGFALTVDAFDEVQDLILADPIHDVDVEQGWPIMGE